MKGRLVRRIGAAAAVASAGVLALALPASATVTLTSSGSKAVYDSPSNVLKLSDTQADGRYVYVWYNWGTSTSTSTATRLENHAGNGSTQQWTLSPGGASQITLMTCTEIGGGPDNCSGWATTPA